MKVEVELFEWPAVSLAPGAEVRFVHYITDANGSLIDAAHWYGMSAAPDTSDVRVDRPLSEKAVELTAEGGHRPRAERPEASRYDWYAFWRNPRSGWVSFRPRMLMAPAR